MECGLHFGTIYYTIHCVARETYASSGKPIPTLVGRGNVGVKCVVAMSLLTVVSRVGQNKHVYIDGVYIWCLG